jgi:hypothetical protein
LKINALRAFPATAPQKRRRARRKSICELRAEKIRKRWKIFLRGD